MNKRFFPVALFCLILFASITVSAKDTWIAVHSKNFNLIGNASEKEIRAVATKLEQFRETFKLLFTGVKFTNAVQTNVVVFKSGSTYNPFRPKQANGKPDTGIAGYFQSGEDVNYITLSTEGEREDTYGTIFHEYVHYMLDTNFGKSEVPPWFGEGLAEYYQTFQIKEDQKILLGNIQDSHLYLLQNNKMMPLRQFFQVNNYSLHQNGNHSRSIFYAQAWALIHYLIQANKGANRDEMGNFLSLVMRKVEPEAAFKQVFGYDYATMEKALEKYVSQRTFVGTMVALKEKLIFDADMIATPLSDTEANAYLGDLLYHTHEYSDAEKYLQTALTADANSTMANTSMGLVRLRQHRFPEAKAFLEKAILTGQKNHYAYYNYAYVLSRENMDEFNYVSSFPPDKAEKIRAALKKAIEINPGFSESYRLYAFVNMVNDENLDESLTYLKKGLALQPGNQNYILSIAQIYARQEKIKEANELAQKIMDTAEDDGIRQQAQGVLTMIRQIENAKKYNAEVAERNKTASHPVLIRTGRKLSPEEMASMQEQFANISLNRALDPVAENEKQASGYFQKVDCSRNQVSYAFKTDAGILNFVTKDFSELRLLSLTKETTDLAFGCDAKVQDSFAVVTYLPAKTGGSTLTSIAFVPKTFKLMTAEETDKAESALSNVGQSGSPAAPVSPNVSGKPVEETGPSTPDDFENRRRDAMMQQIKEAMHKPLPNEKQVLGTIERVECVKNKIIFHIRSGAQLWKYGTVTPNELKTTIYTSELGGLQLGCNVNVPQIPVVVTFVPNNDPKAKENGTPLFFEFVPRSFTLDTAGSPN